MQLKSLLRPAVFPFLAVRARFNSTSRRGAGFGAKAGLHDRVPSHGKRRRATI